MRRINKRSIFGIFILGTLVILLTVYTVTTKKNFGASSSCVTAPNITGEIDLGEKTAIFEGKEIQIPEIVFKNETPPVLGVSAAERWIEIDLSEQKIRAWDGGSLYLESLVSTGLPWWPTPKGEFRIQTKSRSQKMEGGSGKYYYYLPNVPYVMFFGNESLPASRGYSLHGTYWHNDFGRVHSHGCVNLPTPIAEQLYYWTTPVVPEGKGYVRSDEGGTKVVIHD